MEEFRADNSWRGASSSISSICVYSSFGASRMPRQGAHAAPRIEATESRAAMDLLSSSLYSFSSVSAGAAQQ